MNEEFKPLDAYHIRLAREVLDVAAADVTKIQNQFARADGDQTEMLTKKAQEIKNKINRLNDLCGLLLISGCTEER